MSHIRGRGNKDTELALMQIFREHKITGWRRHALISLRIPGPQVKFQNSRKHSQQSANLRTPDLA
jgi:hypothetical protein